MTTTLIMIAAVIIFGAILIVLYFFRKEICIHEMPNMPMDWNFTKAKKHEGNTILLTGNN